MKNTPQTDELLRSAKRIVSLSPSSEFMALARYFLKKAIADFEAAALPGISDEVASRIICACDESMNDMSARQ